jgi:hypothetical protein
MANKEAVFTLRVNTGNSVQDVQSFDKSIQNLNKDIQEVQNTASSGTGIDTFDAKLQELNAKVEAGGLTMRQMTQVMKEYQTIAAQAGMESPIGQQAISAAAELKDTIGDLKNATTALSSDFVGLDTALAGVETGAAVFQGFESAVALTGVESEALVQTMVKLQAAQGLVSAATQIANNLNKDAILGIQLRTAAEKAYGLVVGQTTGALKVLRIALAATGIGAIILLVGGLIANFQSLTDAIGLTSESQRALDATMDAYAKGAEEATQKTSEMEAQFALAEKGVISKEEALQFYNDTLGESLGSASNLNEAEQLYLDKKDAFIQATAERAQAQELFSLAAKESAEAFRQKIEIEQNASLDYYSNLIGTVADVAEYVATGDEEFNRSTQVRKKFNDDLTAAVDEGANKRIAAYQKEGQRLLESATLTEQKAGIVSQSEAAQTLAKEKAEKAEKAAEEAKRKREKAAEERRRAAEKAAEEAKRRAEEEAKRERERLANLLKLEQDFRVQVQEIENEYYDSLLTAKEREENVVYDKYFTLIQQAKQYGMSTTALEAARTAELAKITKDYNDKELEAQKVIDDAKLESAKAYRLLFADEYEQDLISFEDTQKEQADALNTALENKTITEEEYLKGQEKLEADYAAKLVEINDKKNQVILDANKKAFEDRMTEIQGYIDQAQIGLNTLSAINDLANQLGQNRIDQVNAQAEEQTAALEKQQQEELSNANLTAQEKTAIEQNFNKQKQEVLLKAYNEEERIKKAQFERDKAFKISQIAIDTASAILKAISTYGPPPSPLGIFGIASASAIGIAQAATVAATKYKGGTPPAASSAGGGSVSTGASASQFSSVNTNTQQTNLADILGGGGSGTPTTSKVFVLESDITNTQQKVAVQQQLSTY